MTSRGAWIAAALAVAALSISSVFADDENAGPQTFETPEAAAKAVVEATRTNDDKALQGLVGPDERTLIQNGGDPFVAADRKAFAERAAERMKLRDNEDGSKTMVVGHNRWPLPVPIVKGEKGWHFDAKAGRDEMLNRRIGDNELTAIALCRMYARAQYQYASEDRDEDGVREYAQRIKSSEGAKDGLYWESGEGEELSPFGPLVQSAKPYLAGRKPGDPFGGYYWHVLTAQGDDAPGGKHSYIINGNMIAGFGLIGVPSNYGNTGIMTFMVSHHGEVLQKDLGKDSLTRCRALHGFDPDSSWTVVEGE